jgi:alcohol dehydrogenase (cytochrome c)
MLIFRQKSVLVTVAALLLLGTSGLSGGATQSQVRAQGSVTADPDMLALPAADWLTSGGNLYNERYSQLDQITTRNVGTLTGAWEAHLHSGIGAKYSQEATPLVENGIMYVSTGNDDVTALNAATGARIWQYTSGISQEITTVCCGWNNRGVAIGGGRVYVAQLDGAMVALNQKTGKVIWRTEVVRWQDGYGMTAAPRYYNGVVYTGMTGAEFGVRGRLTALDAATGRILWRFSTTAAPGTVGGNTWPAHSDAYLHGGASIWNTPAIDPRLGLIYFSTGNAGPDFDGNVRPGENLFSASIIALHMNGTLAWYFQTVHHDIWDFDLASPVVLFTIRLNGTRREAIGEAGKTGWVYLLDRTTGKPLIGIVEKPVPQDAKQATWPTQPFPVGDATVPQCATPVAGFPRAACIFTGYDTIATIFQPLFEGGTVQSPMAFDPRTHYLYVTGDIWPGALALTAKFIPFKPGITYLNGGATGNLPGATVGGTLSAVNATTNRIVWQIKTPYVLGMGSGVLATAGDLIFVGHPDGTLRAYNAKTGQQLWQWQTGYGADAPAITYEVHGVQYVAIAAGGNSPVHSANGDAVWAFRLSGAAGGPTLPQAPKPPVQPPHIVGFTSDIVQATVVDMVDFGFQVPYFNLPAHKHVTSNRITVTVGARVTFVNLGVQAHTATSNLPVSQGGFDTGLVQPGQAATITLHTAGTFNYYCVPEPWMIGQIIVRARGTPPPPGTLAVAQAWPGVPIILGEMGYSNKMVVDDSTQEAVLSAEFAAIAPLPSIAGINYWVGTGTDTSGGYTHIFSGSPGRWTPRPAARDLAAFFAQEQQAHAA